MTESKQPQGPQAVDEYAETQVLGKDQGPGGGSAASGRGDDGDDQADVEQLREALDDARSQAQEHREQMLRTAAEIDNLRKRSAREVEHARRFGAEKLAAELLGVVDSLELGLEAARQEGAVGALIEGQEATLKLLSGVLEKFGVTPVVPLGERFNPEYHEAMSMVPAPDAEPGSVIVVVQKGYLLHGRLLRPARVVVAADSPAGGQ
ncbi:MAG: nucleotide exchange factor GrpE [Gammaproteobacteria bacterium]|nr:nucleotide exchange factor GrpE [Gammaproteobacteria bacterium]